MAQRIAYVTGGMGGIGTAICQRLSKGGFKEIAGSWWPDFTEWLAEYGGRQVPAPQGYGGGKYKKLVAAPGTYVKEKAQKV